MKSILPIAAAAQVVLAAAHAAPYRVYACDGPDDGPLSIRPFEDFETPASTMNHDDYCREPNGSALFEWAAGALPADRAGGYRLRASSETPMTELRWAGGVTGVSGSGARVEIDTDRGLVAAWTADLQVDTRIFALPSGTTTVELRQVCRSLFCTGPVRTTIYALTRRSTIRTRRPRLTSATCRRRHTAPGPDVHGGGPRLRPRARDVASTARSGLRARLPVAAG